MASETVAARVNWINHLSKVLLVPRVEPPELVGGVVLVGHVALGAELDGGAVRARPPESHDLGGGGGSAAAAAARGAVVAGAHGAAVDDPEVVGALELKVIPLSDTFYSYEVSQKSIRNFQTVMCCAYLSLRGCMKLALGGEIHTTIDTEISFVRLKKYIYSMCPTSCQVQNATIS